MSYQFRRLSDLIEDIRYRFSIGGARNRHPPARIRQLYNSSWQQLRTIVSLANDGTFMQATDIQDLPTDAAVSGEVYAEVDWPLNASRIFGIRVQRTSSSRWYPLKPLPWAALHDYQNVSLIDSWCSHPGPRGYIHRVIPSAAENVETVGKIMIVPVPTGGSYRLWYMESWQPQVEDDDLFPGHEEWHEWAIWNTMIKMLAPDADSQKMYGMWSAERGAARTLIEATALRLSDGMAMEPRDARGDGDPDDYGGPL